MIELGKVVEVIGISVAGIKLLFVDDCHFSIEPTLPFNTRSDGAKP